MAGTPVPGHVYDEIDTHLAEERWGSAWNAAKRAVEQYQDRQLRIYNCLWVYQKGAQAAQRGGYPEAAIAFWSKFISQAEYLVRQDPHILKVHLDACEIRPPRSDEIDQARGWLGEAEEMLREKRRAEGAGPEEVEAEIEKHRRNLVDKGKGCLVALLLSPLVLLGELIRGA